jgi:ribosomal protein S18 acetylase RimI-like enzyme
MEINKISVMGMELEQWKLEACEAEFGIGDGWATLYIITTDSHHQGKGLATKLLTEAKRHYEAQGKKFGGTVALNETMADIYKRLEIKEYKD